jgi:hypothetical protein
MMRTVALTTALGILWTSAVGAQQLTIAQRVAALQQGEAANLTALHKYTWLQTTKMALNGEVRQSKVESCEYAEAPTPECTEISSTAMTPTGGFFRRRAEERKIKEIKAYMDSVKTLMELYVPPQAAKIEAAASTGNISVAKNPSTASAKVVISNYAQQGDAVTLVVSDPSEKLRTASIHTWLNDNSHTVTLMVTYAWLPDGTRYPASKVLTASAQGITVTTTMANFAMAIGSAPQ